MKRVLLLAAVFLLIAGVGVAAPADSEGAFHYRLNESSGSTASDWSPPFVDGTYNGNLPNSVSGVQKGSGNWDTGTAQDFQNNTDENIQTSAKFTGNGYSFSMWLNHRDVAESSFAARDILFDARNYAAEDGRIHYLASTERCPTEDEFGIFDGDSDKCSGYVVPDHLVMLTFEYDDGSDTAFVWENTTLKASWDIADMSSGTDSAAELGTNDGGNRPLSGMVDEFHFYNSTDVSNGNLSDTQIQNLFDSNQLTAPNDAPVIDSNTTRPAPNQVVPNDNVDTVVNATDSDGDPMSAWVTVNEDGTDIVTDKSMSQPSTGDFQDLNTFTTDELNVWYNVTYTVGDGSANTTSDLQIFNEDNPPTITYNNPPTGIINEDDVFLNATINDDLSTWANVTAKRNNTQLVSNFNNTVKYFYTNQTNDLALGLHNFSITAWDNQQQKTTATREFTIQNIAPNVTLLNPTNTTFFDYDLDYTFHVNETDQLEDDTMTCTVTNETVTVDTPSPTANATVKGTLRNRLTTSNFSVSCDDENGATDTDFLHYTVDDIEFVNTSFTNQTFETRLEGFTQWMQVGDMVGQVNATLQWWNATPALYNTTTFPPNGVRNIKADRSLEIPLRSFNNTKAPWNYNISYNRTDFDGTGSTPTETTANQTQFTWWAYNLTESALLPLNTGGSFTTNYTEGVDYTHQFNLSNRTDAATLTATNTYYHPFEGSTDAVPNPSFTGNLKKFEASQTTGNVTLQDAVFEQFNVSSEVKIAFNDDTRFIDTGNDTLTLEKIVFTDCSAGTASQTVALNLSTYDENNRDQFVATTLGAAFRAWKDTATIRTFNFSSGSTGNGKKFHEFCIFPADENYTVDSTERLIQYSDDPETEGDHFETRSHFLIEEPVNNDVTDIPLYLVNSTEETVAEVEYFVQDEDSSDAVGIVTRIERYFEEDDKHLTVAMIRTGSEGSSRTFLETNEIFYQHKFYEDSSLVDTKEDQVVPEDNEFNFQIGTGAPPSYFEFIGDLGFSCSDTTTFVNCSVSSDTESLSRFRLEVERIEAVGTTEICDKNISTASGELACSELNTTENTYKYGLTADMNDGTKVLLESAFLDAVSDDYGTIGVTVTLALFLTLGFAGLFLPEAVIILGTFAILLSAATNLIALPLNAVATILLVVAILLWRMT